VTPPRRRYPTDLTDAEGQLLAPLIPAPKPGGRPALHDRRELVNAMASWLRAGCAWWRLPMTCRPGRPSTTTSAAGDSKGCGSRSTACCASRSGSGRGDGQRPAQSSWIARSSRPPNGGLHGCDGAKRVNGRKRHLLVDTLGLVIKVHMTAADVGDHDGAVELLGGWTGGGSPGCGTAGSMAATAARSWTGHASTGASCSRWCRAATVGGSGAGSRPG
jgi:putative transposase